MSSITPLGKMLLLCLAVAFAMSVAWCTAPGTQAQELPVRCSVPMEYGRLVTVFEGDYPPVGRDVIPDEWLGVFEDSQGTIRVIRLICPETFRDAGSLDAGFVTNGLPERQ